MANARIERMVKELKSDPSAQFFEVLLGLVRPARKDVVAETTMRDCIVATFVDQRARRSRNEDMSARLEKAA